MSGLGHPAFQAALLLAAGVLHPLARRCRLEVLGWLANLLGALQLDSACEVCRGAQHAAGAFIASCGRVSVCLDPRGLASAVVAAWRSVSPVPVGAVHCKTLMPVGMLTSSAKAYSVTQHAVQKRKG